MAALIDLRRHHPVGSDRAAVLGDPQLLGAQEQIDHGTGRGAVERAGRYQ